MTRSDKRIIVPFFISHQGCPHSCIFCDQRRISGIDGSLPSVEEVSGKVRAYRKSSRQATVEVAFYGGTFTMLPLTEQKRLLASLQPLLDSGDISAIRLSTRPDAITSSVTDLLLKYRVSLVELGVQSMDDRVLAAAGRGHSSSDTRQAFRLLTDAGIAVGAQLMPGLPGDSPEGSIRSLYEVLALKPKSLRVYPAVVVAGTELAHLFQSGEYFPLSLPAAVALGARHLHAALRAGVPVIRMGLQATDLLSGPDGILAGPWHPAFRQLVESELCCNLLCLLTSGKTGSATVAVHPSRISDVTGQHGTVRHRLQRQGITLNKVVADPMLTLHDLAVILDGTILRGNIMTDLIFPDMVAYHA